MAAVNFTAGKFLSLKNDGSINASGTVEFFEPDGTYSTYKTTYSDKALTTPNSNTITLDSAGRAQIYFSGDADLRVRDSAAVSIYSQRNVNPVTLTAIFPLSTATNIVSTYDSSIIEASGTTTLTLDTASVLGEGWKVTIRNVGSGIITLARTTGGDSINGTSANITISAGDAGTIHVNDGASGFNTVGFPLSLSQTYTGENTHSGLESFAKTKFSVPLGPNYLNNISIDATVAANALTATLYGNDGAAPSATNPVQLSFRSSTLTTGTTTVATATAATTVVAPSGATLGFIASEDSYVYVYALNNAGTVELALSGSPSWDTNILQSTTAIGTGSDTKAILYSTSARTNVAIRFIGLIKIATGATPGQWGTAATIKATATDAPPVLSIGYCQTWTDVTGSRSSGVTYTNSTGRPIMVKFMTADFSAASTTFVAEIYVGATTANLLIEQNKISNDGSAVTHKMCVSGIVPPGWVYQFAGSGVTLGATWELR